MSNASRLRAALAAVLLLAVTVPVFAATPADTAKAKEYFQKGQVNFELKEFEEALKQFKDAYRYVQDPVLLYNIAQCHYKLGHRQEALDFYRNYLRRAPQASNRAEVDRRIQELEKAPVAAIPPVEPIGAPKRPEPVIVPPSPAVVVPPVAVAPPASVATPSSRPPSTAIPALTPPPTAPPPIDLTTPVSAEPASSSTPIYKRWWFWTGVGAVVAAGVIATVAIVGRGQVGDCMTVSPCLKVHGP